MRNPDTGKDVRLTRIELDDREWRRLKACAAEHGVTQARELADAIRAWINKETQAAA